jgi:hypothetical protein
MLVHSGTIRLDSASSNRNSLRFTAPNSWDIASRGNFLKSEGGVTRGGTMRATNEGGVQGGGQLFP